MRFYYLTIMIFILGLSACAPAPTTNGSGVGVVFDEIRPVEPEQGLGFPYENPDQAVVIHCFALCPWENPPRWQSTNLLDNLTRTDAECTGEKHIGIDIYPDLLGQPHEDPSPGTETRFVRIVAPADGTIAGIKWGETGATTISYVVAIALNDYWYVAYSFEPHSDAQAIQILQESNIFVTEQQKVKKGDLIGNLVVSDNTEVEPSLHFSFFYRDPEEDLDQLFERLQTDIRSVKVSDGRDVENVGSPWDAQYLGIPTTFFCPYEFSDKRAKDLYDEKPKLDFNGNECSSLCAYGSNFGNCGRRQFQLRD